VKPDRHVEHEVRLPELQTEQPATGHADEQEQYPDELEQVNAFKELHESHDDEVQVAQAVATVLQLIAAHEPDCTAYPELQTAQEKELPLAQVRQLVTEHDCAAHKKLDPNKYRLKPLRQVEQLVVEEDSQTPQPVTVQVEGVKPGP
jgi:hypothetical protein